MFPRTVMLVSVICMGLQALPQVVTSSTPLDPSLGLYSDKFQVTVTQSGKSYTSYTYISRANTAQSYALNGSTFSYSIFSFSQPVSIVITKLNSSASSATIRPNRSGLGKINTTPVGTGSSVQFTLSAPAKLSVEFNDDPALKDAFVLFADSLEVPQNVPNTANSNVYTVTGNNVSSIPAGTQIVYFTPGLHTIGYWNIPSTITQVYLPNGSFIRGYFYASRYNLGSIMINGRGVLSEDIYPFHNPDSSSTSSANWYKAVEIEGGSNHTIEGITITDGSSFNIIFAAQNCLVKNVNIHGFKINNDGITTGGDQSTVDNCFVHVNDDGIILYGNDITIKNSVIWQLPGGSIIQLGWRPVVITGTNVINNMDVIHAGWTDTSADNVGFINAMNSLAGSSTGLVENFTVSNIYFDTDILRFLDIRMKKNGVGQPTNFSNFSFLNIYMQTNNGSDIPLIYLSSYDATHKITGFTFKGIYINNQICSQVPWDNDFITTDALTTVLFN
jgi:hypothetical protein